ncbi:RNA polymerase subunit sigma [Rhodococcus rhodnii]|nr:sigma-70 family RNA polymerase sigma factor [Rhodococcus rhodnii]TXG89341.1 RNA polymerase subunit sigma [Rhodococcus rhodnii]
MTITPHPVTAEHLRTADENGCETQNHDPAAEFAALPPDDPGRACALAAAVDHAMPIARAAARRYSGRGQPLEDLMQVAYCGLIAALHRFDPGAGASFSTYGSTVVHGEIRKYFRDCTWPVHVPRSAREIRGSLGEVRTELEHRLGRPPSNGELASHYDVSRAVIANAEAAQSCYRTEQLDLVHEPTAEDGASDVALDVRASLRPAIARMSRRRTRILHERFVLDRTQSRIAAEIGCSQVQVSRELRQILATLRDALVRDGHPITTSC